MEPRPTDRLSVERPVVQARPSVQLPLAAVGPFAFPSVLEVGHHAARGGAVVCAHDVLKQDLLERAVLLVIADDILRMGEDVACAVDQLPFVELIVDDFVAHLNAPFREVGLFVPGK